MMLSLLFARTYPQIICYFGKVLKDYSIIVRGKERDRTSGGNANTSAFFIVSVSSQLCIN